MNVYQLLLPLALATLSSLTFAATVKDQAGAPTPTTTAHALAKPAIIEAFWGNKWWKAHIIEKSVDPANPQAGVQNKVHYEGSWSYFDEWLAADKLRTLDGSPLLAPTPTADDLAVAARDKLAGADFFTGTWSLGGIPVMNVVKSEETGDGKTLRETRQMQGGGDRGYLRINADGTFIWAGGPGGKTSGRWHQNTDPKIPSDLVLEQADRVIGDAYVSRKRSAMISVMKGLGGPTSYGAPVWDDKDLLLLASVGPEFFHGKWKLNRPRSSTLLKSDYGLLEIRADGTFTHTDAGKKTSGKWERADQGESLVLNDPWGEGDFRVKQDGASAGFRSQGVQQTHIGVSGRRPDAK